MVKKIFKKLVILILALCFINWGLYFIYEKTGIEIIKSKIVVLVWWGYTFNRMDYIVVYGDKRAELILGDLKSTDYGEISQVEPEIIQECQLTNEEYKKLKIMVKNMIKDMKIRSKSELGAWKDAGYGIRYMGLNYDYKAENFSEIDRLTPYKDIQNFWHLKFPVYKEWQEKTIGVDF